MAIADGGYKSRYADEREMLAIPNTTDPPHLKNFKSRVRQRHESLNGRLKFFKCLSETFRHGVAKHKSAFEAVAVTVQYQMDNGGRIFDA